MANHHGEPFVAYAPLNQRAPVVEVFMAEEQSGLIRVRGQLNSVALDVRQDEIVEVDPSDPVWADALEQGFVVPVDETTAGAVLAEGENTPGLTATEREADAQSAKAKDQSKGDTTAK